MGYRGTDEHAAQLRRGRAHARAGGPARSATSSASSTAGLAYMFHMMNEARIGVGMGAAALGYTGYLHALDYARDPHPGPPGRRARTPPRRRCRSSSTPTCAGCCWPQKSYVGGRAGARPVLRPAGRRGADRRADAEDASQRAPAAGHAHPDREELAVAVVPGGQRPRHPGARRLRLHPRLRRRAVLPRQPAQPDPRGHPRHPGAGPARPQGGHAGRRRARAARRDDRGDHGPGGGHRVGRPSPPTSTPPSRGWAR